MEDAFPTGWGLAAAINQWLLYSAALFAAGSALFVLWVPVPPAAKALTRGIGRRASGIAAICYILAIGLVGADLLGVPGGIFDPRSWAFGTRTTLVSSAGFGVTAMGFLLWSFIRPGKLQRLLVLAGSALMAASFLVTGHPAATAPRWIGGPAYALHLLGAAFWLGALAPLRCAISILPPDEAWATVAAFSRRAVTAVAAIATSGVVLGAVHLGSPAALTASSYGQRLLIKVALAAVVIAIAAYNNVVLTPALERGVPDAKPRLRLSIAAELILLVLILGAAVTLTLVPLPTAD